MAPVGRGSRHILGCLLAAFTLAVAGCGGDAEEPPSLPERGAARDATAATDELAGPGANDTGSGTEAGSGGGEAGSRGERDDRERGDAGSREGGQADERGGSGDGSGRAPGPLPGSPAPRSDSDDARELLTSYISRFARGDGSVCTDVFTLRHAERTTGRKGQAALQKCREDVSARTRAIRLVELESVRRIADDRLHAVAALASGNRGFRSEFELLRVDGRLRIDAAG